MIFVSKICKESSLESTVLTSSISIVNCQYTGVAEKCILHEKRIYAKLVNENGLHIFCDKSKL